MWHVKNTIINLLKNVAFLSVFLVPGLVNASSSNGTIDTTYKITKVCQDTSCSIFGNVNWKPTINTMTPGALPVAITDTSITGHIWGDQIGWINLAPLGAGIFVSPTTGVITGKAFASGGSWINFNPTGQSVSLVDNGTGSNFQGWAWVSGPYGGWMKFDCVGIGTCIKTDWRTSSNRTISGGGGGGGIIILPPLVPTNPIDLCPNILDIQITVPSGYALISGSCVQQQVDFCPNISGIQTSILSCQNEPQKPNLNRPNINIENNQNSPLGNQSIQNKDNSIIPVNKFDQDSDGEPDRNPSAIIGSNIKEQDNSFYQRIFPKRTYQYVKQKPCVFCLIVRKDTITYPTTEEIENRKIVKYAFIPKILEIHIPFSRLPEDTERNIPATRKDIDATSGAVTFFGLVIFRTILYMCISRTLIA